MKIEFSVANAMKSLVSTNAEINGEQQKVLADGLEVELVPVASAHGSLMLRFIGKDATEAAGLFQKDHKVSFECKND